MNDLGNEFYIFLTKKHVTVLLTVSRFMMNFLSNHPAYAYTHQNSDGMRKRARRKSEKEKV